jgi:hypothetical protein
MHTTPATATSAATAAATAATTAPASITKIIVTVKAATITILIMTRHNLFNPLNKESGVWYVKSASEVKSNMLLAFDSRLQTPDL